MSYSDDLRVLSENAPFIRPRNVKNMYKQRAGFFVPYKDFADFGSTLAAPILDPMIFVLTGTAYLGVSAIALAASAACLGGAACSLLLFGCFTVQSAGAAGVSLIFGLAAFGLGLMNTAVALLSIPYNLGSLLSRTATSIVSLMLDCCSPSAEDHVGLKPAI